VLSHVLGGNDDQGEAGERTSYTNRDNNTIASVQGKSRADYFWGVWASARQGRVRSSKERLDS
jgi:predicted metalloprotease